jgi:hypothetical protein
MTSDRAFAGAPWLDIILFLGLIVVSLFIFPLTSDMTPGAELFPRITAAGLIFFGIVELGLIAFRIWRPRTLNAGEPSDISDPSSRKKALRAPVTMGVFFVLVLLFLYAFDVIGFVASGFLLMIASMWLLERQRVWRYLPVALAVPLMLLVIFGWGLNIRLPAFPLMQ